MQNVNRDGEWALAPVIFDMSGLFREGRADQLWPIDELAEGFTYRGLTCMVRRLHYWFNGYMAGPISVDSYDEAHDKGASAHGGFTYYRERGGVVMLGFDTGHWGDTPETTQNLAYVRGAIIEAVDSLYAAGLVAIQALPSGADQAPYAMIRKE